MTGDIGEKERVDTEVEDIVGVTEIVLTGATGVVGSEGVTGVGAMAKNAPMMMSSAIDIL